MQIARLLAPLLLTGSALAAQLAEGDLLLNGSSASQALCHYTPSGAQQQCYAPASTDFFTGAAVLPDGTWVVLRRDVTPRLEYYAPGTGIVLQVVDLAAWSQGSPSDVAARRDGTLLVLDPFASGSGGRVLHLSRDGEVLHTLLLSGGGLSPTTLAVDDADRMAIGFGSATDGKLQLRAGNGSLLFEIPTSFSIFGLDISPEGRIWTVEVDGFVFIYDLLGNLAPGGLFNAFSFSGGPVKVMHDGSAWFAAQGFAELRHYQADGTLLGSFATGTSQVWDLETARSARVGTNYCGANINSSGAEAQLVATGSTQVGDNELHLLGERMPPNEFGYLLNSDTPGFVANPGGSAGNLCLGGTIGRHTSDLAQSGNGGSLHTQIDLTQLPRGGQVQSVMAGESWSFQLWFRDGNTSNFTDAMSVTFQ